MGVPKRRKEFVRELRGRMKDGRQAIENALPETIDVDRFLDVAQTAALQNNGIEDATIDSAYAALKKCAASGLMPDGEESTVVVYDSTAVWMPMVKGIVRLMLRSPGVTKVESRVVRSKDEFEFSYGIDPTLEHRPKQDASDENFDPSVDYAYAVVFRREAEPQFEVLARSEIERARKTSRAPESPAWRNWYPEMARKVSLHRVSKYVDLAPEARRAIQQDIEAGWETSYAERRTRAAREKVQGDADGRGGRILDEVRAREKTDDGESVDESGSSDEPGEDPADPVRAEDEQGLAGETGDEGESETRNRDVRDFVDEEGLDPESDLLTKRDVEEVPDGFGLVNYAPTWYHPVLPDGTVREDVSLRKDPAVAWVREKRGEQMYDVEEPTTEEKAGADVAPAGESPKDGPDWTPTEEMSLTDMRKEMGAIVRATEGWEFPGFIVRFGTKMFRARKDELPTSDGWVDVTELERPETERLLEELREAAVEKRRKSGE